MKRIPSLWEQILSFKRSSHFEKGRNWRKSLLDLEVSLLSLLDLEVSLWEQILSFKRSSHFEKGRNWRKS